MFAGNKAVQFFYVMSENHIGLDKFTAFFHAVFSMLLPFTRLLETFMNAFGHGFRQDINQHIPRSACQSLVGKRHRGVYSYTRFQTGIGCSFTRTMNTNERFEKVHISQFFGLGALDTNRKSLFKSNSDFLLIFYLNPFEYWGYVIFLKSQSGRLNHGAVKGVAMGIRLDGQTEKKYQKQEKYREQRNDFDHFHNLSPFIVVMNDVFLIIVPA